MNQDGIKILRMYGEKDMRFTCNTCHSSWKISDHVNSKDDEIIHNKYSTGSECPNCKSSDITGEDI